MKCAVMHIHIGNKITGAEPSCAIGSSALPCRRHENTASINFTERESFSRRKKHLGHPLWRPRPLRPLRGKRLIMLIIIYLSLFTEKR